MLQTGQMGSTQRFNNSYYVSLFSCLFRQEGRRHVTVDHTSGLDKDNEAIVMSLLKKLNESGVTIIMVTHNLNLCDYFSRVIDVEKYR